MKIVFMGTPTFALPTLKKIVEQSSHEVVCVYSQPPRPAGRGHKLQNSIIHEYALSQNIEIRTPKTLRNTEIQQKFADLKADIAIVIAYGLILPKEILKAYPKGCLNIHPSLLPRWRGAAPIQRTIMSGDTKTGVAIMQMDEGLDTGDVVAFEKYDIKQGTTSGMLHDIMSEKGAELLVKTLDEIEKGNLTRTKQSEIGVTYADKISKAEAEINWNDSAQDIYNNIMGLSPYPAAFFMHNNEKYKILNAEYDLELSGKAGEILDDKLTIACKDGTIKPTLIQRQGKKAMAINEFLKGNKIAKGTILG